MLERKPGFDYCLHHTSLINITQWPIKSVIVPTRCKGTSKIKEISIHIKATSINVFDKYEVKKK